MKGSYRMKRMSPELLAVWADRQSPVILTTVDADGMPNSIYATCANHFSDEQLVVADNYFNKTRANLLNGTKGSILFMTTAGKAIQIKGTMAYETEGEIFADMKCWNPEKHPGHAAAVMMVEEAYSGAEKLL
jgi:predicted pyridoxine 5'-phosphate oxidase superfamily flavin-nucleotide-binding protein